MRDLDSNRSENDVVVDLKGGTEFLINNFFFLIQVSQTLTPTPQELHALSRSLLRELTRKSPPAPPSSYTTASSDFPSSSSSWPFSLIEDYISHRFSWLGKGLKYLYAGKAEGKSKTGRRDYSISGVLRQLYSFISSFLSPPIRHSRPSASSTSSTPSTSTGLVNRWTTTLFSTLSGAESTWSEREMSERLVEVMRMAREAGEGGVKEAWVTLGDLYLVRRLFFSHECSPRF